MARIWRSSHKWKPILPGPCKFGWKLRDDTEHYYEPIMTNEKPAPVSVVELSFCNCKHGCETKRCTCNKNNLICSEMCFFQHCENQDEGNENYIDDIDSRDY